MKQVGFVHIEVEKGEKLFSFMMPMGVPLADAADAAFQVFKSCDKMYRDAMDKEAEKQEKLEIESDEAQEN